MAARKRVPNKPKTFIGQHLNGTSDSKCNSKLPRTSTATLITSDVTTYLKLSVLILLVAGVVGFLLYPDILNVLRTVQGNAGFNEQTRKQELQTEKLRVIDRNNVEDDDKLSPSDEDDAKVILADETDHENVSPLENTKKRKFKEEEMINQKNSLEPGESVAAFDEDDSDLVVYDSIGHEDLMEDEEKETQLKMLKSSLNLNPEAKQGATKLEDTTMSQAESLNKETRNQQPKDKMSSADEKIREGRPGKSLDKTGKKSGPIILNAQNSHVVLDPSQIKIINSSLDKKPETKQQSHSKKHQDAPKTQTNQNKTRKSNAKIKAEKPTKVNAEANEEKKPLKKLDTKMSSNKIQERSNENADNVLEKAKKFNATYQKTFTPKKIFADGRRIPPIELLHQKKSNSSVRVFLFDEFLSKQECDGLIKAHDSHVKALNKPPILCFDSIATLRRHISDVKQNISVTPNDFTKGTKCVNASFSLQLQTWMNSNWSFSTAFYPGESTFSKVISYRIKEAMGLDPASGGKFQITSYPEGKAYKEHTDCTLGGVDKRDRVVSVLMYLSDVEDGGETAFPYLGIWAKPKKGRALVWNNMSPDGVCEEHSKHIASVVKKGSKYILIRWYYYKTFYSLGKRPPPPPLPEREPDQAMVSCDEYNSGSCRWYDEWSYDSLLDYEKNKRTLV